MHASDTLPVAPLSGAFATFGLPSHAARRRVSLFRRALRVLYVGVAPVALALGLSLGLQHLFPYPFLFLFLGAVVVSSWFGGVVSGMVSVVASSLCVIYFFVPPFRSFAVT